MRCKITVNKYTEVGKFFALFGENKKYQINSAFLFLKNFGNDVLYSLVPIAKILKNSREQAKEMITIRTQISRT